MLRDEYGIPGDLPLTDAGSELVRSAYHVKLYPVYKKLKNLRPGTTVGFNDDSGLKGRVVSKITPSDGLWDEVCKRQLVEEGIEDPRGTFNSGAPYYLVEYVDPEGPWHKKLSIVAYKNLVLGEELED